MVVKIAFFILFCLVSQPAWAETARALITGTAPDSDISGSVSLEEVPDGLAIEIKVENVSPGPHGFHIHEKGSCAEGGSAAGGHYNPNGVQHGFIPKDGFQAAHAGDFGNIDVRADGTGSLSLVIPGLTISGGKYNVKGRAVILHEKQDDFGQPTGNAGGRIGCGLIE